MTYVEFSEFSSEEGYVLTRTFGSGLRGIKHRGSRPMRADIYMDNDTNTEAEVQTWIHQDIYPTIGMRSKSKDHGIFFHDKLDEPINVVLFSFE